MHPPIEARPILAVIDHSALRPDLTAEDIKAACQLGRRLGVAAVCVQPCWAKLAAELLAGSQVKTASVVGFPHGASLTEAKLMEAIALFEAPVAELDMVLNIGWLKSGRYEELSEELGALRVVCSGAGVVLKVILETGYLSDEEKRRGAELAARAGADFVKTNTGFGPSGASVQDVRLLRAALPPRVGIKAAGGVRSLAQVQALLAAGATRIGTSATADLARQLGVEV
jgi:deoxyribose-phosphate aldolase